MEEEAEKLYFRILEIANEFLVNAKAAKVELLAKENPTYESVAELANEIAKFLWVLSDDFDPMMSQKAFEYCHLMSNMGKAISEQNQDWLDELVAELDKKPFL